jgi:arylsulfatase A-like enzyme
VADFFRGVSDTLPGVRIPVTTGRLPSPSCLLALLALLWLPACGPARSGPPDVVLIELDSVRADHVAHLGYELPTTRSLDAFRERAALFSAARSPSSGSAASSASLLTGLAPARLRVGARDPRLDPSHPTLAEALRKAGWATIGVSHHPAIGPDSGLDRGFDEFQGFRGEPSEHPDSAVMADWLREWLARDPPQPFFLYLHPMDAHPPYRVPAGRRKALLGRLPSDAMPYDGALMRAARQPMRRRAREAVGEREVLSLVEQYDTAVRYAFDQVGQMLAMLEQAGRLDDALVVITSSHGQELFEHGGFDSGRTLYEEVLRVPLYVKLPGGSTAAQFDERVSTLDVAPTILELLGLPALPGDGPGDGRSLAPLLRGEVDTLPERDFVHAVMPDGPLSLLRALVRGRSKLIEGIGVSELYDLVLDPREQRDLSGDNREMVLELRRALTEAYPFVPPDDVIAAPDAS